MFGTTAPIVSTFLIERTGNRLAPAWYMVVMACVAMSVAVFALRRVPRDAVETPGAPQSRVAPGAPQSRVAPGAPQSRVAPGASRDGAPRSATS